MPEPHRDHRGLKWRQNPAGLVVSPRQAMPITSVAAPATQGLGVREFHRRPLKAGGNVALAAGMQKDTLFVFAKQKDGRNRPLRRSNPSWGQKQARQRTNQARIRKRRQADRFSFSRGPSMSCLTRCFAIPVLECYTTMGGCALDMTREAARCQIFLNRSLSIARF